MSMQSFAIESENIMLVNTIEGVVTVRNEPRVEGARVMSGPFAPHRAKQYWLKGLAASGQEKAAELSPEQLEARRVEWQNLRAWFDQLPNIEQPVTEVPF